MIEVPATIAVGRFVFTATTTKHDHRRGRPLHAFVGLPGVWVQWHGDWHRPLHVWLYRGAWRVLCHVCMTALQSDDVLYSYGWRTQAAAIDAAVTHCSDCPDVDHRAGAS